MSPLVMKLFGISSPVAVKGVVKGWARPERCAARQLRAFRRERGREVMADVGVGLDVGERGLDDRRQRGRCP